MDFMFEDDVDEVGSDVEAYCPKCKADTTHVVISKYEEEIRRVQCNPCGDVHSFRKPRGEAEDDMPEPVAARKRALLKKLTWEEFFAKHGERGAKPYEFRETYRENAIVFHPKFGKGYVSELVSESKVEVTFADARRILVHNRKDIPGSPVGREDDGLPSSQATLKPGGKAAGKAGEKPAVKQAESKSAALAKVAAIRAEAKRQEVAVLAKVGSKEVSGRRRLGATKPEGNREPPKKAPPKKVVKKAPPKKAAKKAPPKKAAKKAPPKSVAKKAPPKKVAKKVAPKKAAKPAKKVPPKKAARPAKKRHK